MLGPKLDLNDHIIELVLSRCVHVVQTLASHHSMELHHRLYVDWIIDLKSIYHAYREKWFQSVISTGNYQPN